MGIRRRLATLARRSLGRSPDDGPSDSGAPSVKPTPEGLEGPKLNLGCGFDIREGWINVDLHDWHHPDIVADAANLETIEDNFAAYAVAQDILEHIHRDRCLTALCEWNRVLRPDGLLEVRVPDVIAITDLMRRPERANPEHHAVLLQCMFGTQSYEGDFHLNGFTEISLRAELAAAGFEVRYLGHHDEWLFDVVAAKIRHVPPDPLLRSTDDEAFVEGAYQKMLGRSADDEGRAFFLGKLKAGTPREVVLATLRAAEE
jgi:predicted SAM-dependent methyltransferase